MQTDRLFGNLNLIIVAANFLMFIALLYNTLKSILEYFRDFEFKCAVEMFSLMKGVLMTISIIFGLIWSCRHTCEEVN